MNEHPETGPTGLFMPTAEQTSLDCFDMGPRRLRTRKRTELTPRDMQMSIAARSQPRVSMTFRIDPHNDPNEAYEVIQTPAWLRGPPTDWWTVMANGLPVRHYPPHRKDLAIQFATDPAYRALLFTMKLWQARSWPW